MHRRYALRNLEYILDGHAEGVEGSREGADARARKKIGTDAVVFERLEHAEMRISPRTPSTQGQADARPFRICNHNVALLIRPGDRFVQTQILRFRKTICPQRLLYKL